jgi:replicative DNA helicase
MEINRPLPQNVEAEQAVLGALIIEGSLINEVLEVLTPDDFYKYSHKNILNAMIELDKATKPIDILTVFEYLKSKDHMLEDVGGEAIILHIQQK